MASAGLWPTQGEGISADGCKPVSPGQLGLAGKGGKGDKWLLGFCPGAQLRTQMGL